MATQKVSVDLVLARAEPSRADPGTNFVVVSEAPASRLTRWSELNAFLLSCSLRCKNFEPPEQKSGMCRSATQEAVVSRMIALKVSIEESKILRDNQFLLT